MKHIEAKRKQVKHITTHIERKDRESKNIKKKKCHLTELNWTSFNNIYSNILFINIY